MSLHTPGHKQGAGLADFFSEALRQWGPKLDIDPPVLAGSEGAVMPTRLLDAARNKAAEIFGASHTFFLTNGTTAGIQAMFLAAIGEGQVIIPRQIHYSVLGALILSGADPILLPGVGTSSDLPDSRLSPERVREILTSNPGVRGVFVQNPSYFGFSADLTDLAKLAHEFGVPLLVDEAHGPHFSFSADLPPSALEQGADLVVQSTHKLLTSFTGSSMLHLAGQLIDAEALANCVELVHSTSPSFLLLASLEAAVYQLALEGRELIKRIVELSFEVREGLAAIPGVKVLGAGDAQALGYPYWDPTKVVIDLTGLSMSGIEAAEILRKEYKIQVEMADFTRILAVLGPGDDISAISRLELAITDLANRSENGYKELRLPLPPVGGEQVISPRQAFFAPTEMVPLRESAGRTGAQLVAPYPPGIPVVIPGEIITQEQIQYLVELSQMGVQITGISDSTAASIRVVK